MPNFEVTTEIFDNFLTPLIRRVFDNKRQIGTETNNGQHSDVSKSKLTRNRSLAARERQVRNSFKTVYLKQVEICRMIRTFFLERLDIIISRLFCRKSSSSMEMIERVENFEHLKV